MSSNIEIFVRRRGYGDDDEVVEVTVKFATVTKFAAEVSTSYATKLHRTMFAEILDVRSLCVLIENIEVNSDGTLFVINTNHDSVEDAIAAIVDILTVAMRKVNAIASGGIVGDPFADTFAEISAE